METVGELIGHRPITVRRDRTVGEALAVMSEQHVEHVPVVDAAGRYVGLASEGPLRRYGRRGVVELPLDHVITDCPAVRPEEDAIRTFAIQLSEQRPATVVVDAEGRPLGVLGDREVLTLARNHLPEDLVVSQIASRRRIPVLPPDSTARQAVALLADGATHVVVADHDRVWGGLDYRRLAGQDDALLGDLVGKLPRMVRPHTPARAAVNLLLVLETRCLPVVDGAGNLLALLGCQDVLRALTRQLIATSTRPPPPRR